METSTQPPPQSPTQPQPAPRPKSRVNTPARAFMSVLIMLGSFGVLVAVGAGVNNALHKPCGGIPTKSVWKWQSCPAVSDPFALPQSALPQGSLPSFGGGSVPTDPPNAFPIPTSDPGPNGDNPKD